MCIFSNRSNKIIYFIKKNLLQNVKTKNKKTSHITTQLKFKISKN